METTGVTYHGCRARGTRPGQRQPRRSRRRQQSPAVSRTRRDLSSRWRNLSDTYKMTGQTWTHHSVYTWCLHTLKLVLEAESLVCDNNTDSCNCLLNSVPMLFSIFIRFSICVQFSMFRHDSISLWVCVDDSKYSIFLGKWIPSKIQGYQLAKPVDKPPGWHCVLDPN